MMKLNVYSIYDQASGLYSRPFFTQSDAQAVREFTDIALDAEHAIGKHPADYTLFRLGIYDDNNGKLTNEDNSSLGNALERVASARNVNNDNMDLFKKELQKTNGENETEMSNEEILEACSDKLEDLK